MKSRSGANDATLRGEVRAHLLDSREAVAAAAARAAGSLGDSAAVPSLVELLDSERTIVRSAACS